MNVYNGFSESDKFEVGAIVRLVTAKDVDTIILQLAVIAIAAGIEVQLAPKQSSQPDAVSIILRIDSGEMLETRLKTLAEIVTHKNRATDDISSVIKSFSQEGAQIEVEGRIITFPPPAVRDDTALAAKSPRKVEGCLVGINFETNSMRISGCREEIIFPRKFAFLLSECLSQQYIELNTTAHTDRKKTTIKVKPESGLYALKVIAKILNQCVVAVTNALPPGPMNTTATEQFLQFADQRGVPAAAATHLSNSEGIAPILEAALSMHAGDEKAAYNWLLAPCYSLGDKLPIEFGATTDGVDQILDFIDGLESGSYS
jgi:hypothetical protein